MLDIPCNLKGDLQPGLLFAVVRDKASLHWLLFLVLHSHHLYNTDSSPAGRNEQLLVCYEARTGDDFTDSARKKGQLFHCLVDVTLALQKKEQHGSPLQPLLPKPLPLLVEQTSRLYGSVSFICVVKTVVSQLALTISIDMCVQEYIKWVCNIWNEADSQKQLLVVQGPVAVTLPSFVLILDTSLSILPFHCQHLQPLAGAAEWLPLVSGKPGPIFRDELHADLSSSHHDQHSSCMNLFCSLSETSPITPKTALTKSNSFLLRYHTTTSFTNANPLY